MIFYLNLSLSFNKTTGAHYSKNLMCESFRQYNIDAINVLVCPIRVWLKKLLDFNTNDIISLINIKYDNSITDRIFIILNYFIFYHNIKKIGAKVVIIDGLLPLRMFNQNVKVISFKDLRHNV